MPAWSFQPRFREALLQGLAEAVNNPPPFRGLRPKRQTIRHRREDGRDPRPGQECNLWIAQRTPEREFLGRTPAIVRQEIDIAHPGAVVLHGSRIGPGSVTRIARLDGFEEADLLYEFLDVAHGFPFAGYVFRW